MASPYYIGASVTAVAQVDTFTPATVEVNDIFTLTITGEDGTTNAVSFTATGTTVANVTAGLTAAWNASTHRLCTPITAADQTTTMKLTADVAGVAFSVAATTTDGGGNNTQTLTRAATTANVSSSDWNNPGNWSTNAVPVNSDTVTLDGRMQSAILYGLGQSAVTLTALKHYRGALAVGSATSSLRIGVTTLDINLPPEDGSNPTAGFVNINVGTIQTAASVWNAATIGLSGMEPVLFDGTHASNVLNVHGGTVGVSTMTPGDTGTVATLNVIGNTAKAVVAAGVTLTTAILEEGGKAVVRCAATTLTVRDSTCQLTTEGTGAATTINCNGKAWLNSTGTITNLHVENSGDVSTRQTNTARTISNAFVYGNGKLTTDLNTTYSAGIDCLRGANSSNININADVTITPSAT